MKTRLFLFFFLASYAVNCDEDDTGYYIIEVPEDPLRAYKKTFKVYWNVPTFQCKSKKVLFENLHERFGIIQNENDNFKGEKITILYDPGLFPALLKNETSGELVFRNGGLPQEGDLEEHLKVFRSDIEKSVPDPDFNGIGIIDFESWRPIFRQQFGKLVPYKELSYEVERKRHWFWPKQWIEAAAKQRFEDAAQHFFQKTLLLARRMRPNALWGYYAFPYCFNMGTDKAENCALQVQKENDDMYWLWAGSTALFPSIYSSKDLSTSQLASMIRGRLREAARSKLKSSPVLPYFWFRYRDGDYLKKVDLNVALQTIYQSNASGLIIWGSSNDVNSIEKCINLQNYIDNVFGPAIAKYTKVDRRENDMFNEIYSNNNNTPINLVKEEVELKHNSSLETTIVSPVENRKSIVDIILNFIRGNFTDVNKNEDRLTSNDKNTSTKHNTTDIISNISKLVISNNITDIIDVILRDNETHIETNAVMSLIKNKMNTGAVTILEDKNKGVISQLSTESNTPYDFYNSYLNDTLFEDTENSTSDEFNIKEILVNNYNESMYRLLNDSIESTTNFNLINILDDSNILVNNNNDTNEEELEEVIDKSIDTSNDTKMKYSSTQVPTTTIEYEDTSTSINDRTTEPYDIFEDFNDEKNSDQTGTIFVEQVIV